MRDLTAAEVNELYQDLVGTCEDIDTSLQQLFGISGLEELSEDTLGEIDQLLFCCDFCSWWCEANDAAESDPEAGHEDEEFSIRDSDELICKDCA